MKLSKNKTKNLELQFINYNTLTLAAEVKVKYITFFIKIN